MAYPKQPKEGVKAMKIIAKARTLGLVLTLMGLGPISFSLAAEYPTGNIQVVLPYGPGGGSDLGTRIITNYVSKYLGVSFIPVYKPGAGTTLGVKYFMERKPDGYTVFSGAADLSVNFYPKIVKGAGFGIDAMIPLFGYAEVPMVLAVKAEAPWKTFQEFMDDVKKNRNKFSHGSYGATSISHFCMALVNQKAGTETKHVPFESTGKALTALLGGHVDIVAATSLGGGMLKAGKIRALAAALDERTPLLPGVPTLKELGYDVTFGIDYAVWAVKGTPREIQDKLIGAAKQAWEKDREGLMKDFENIEMTAKFIDQKGYEKLILERDPKLDYIIDLLKIPTYHKK